VNFKSVFTAFFTTIILLSSYPLSTIAGPAIGTNGKASQSEATIKSYFDSMQARKLTRYRFDANLANDTDPYEVAMVTMMVKQAKLHGITLKPVLMVPFQWGDRTDCGKYPKGDAQALYSQGYNRTYAFVSKFKTDITDWELGNEINLLAKNASGARLYGQGWTASEFNTPLLNDWAYVLRGMSDAIDKVNSENKLKLRKTLNTTSTMLGFLDFMKSKGVNYDVISYHYYEKLGTDPNYYWGYFNLFYKLSQYKKPIQINEVNCAEIYDATFQNAYGGKLTEACFKSLNNTLYYMTHQNYANIEDIDIYMLYDDYTKTGNERFFGMNWSNLTPKVSAMIATLYAGGTLSASEQWHMTSRGFPNIQK
jgi:hypothetical protein